MGRSMLTSDDLCNAGQSYIDLHNYCIQNSQRGLDIIMPYKDHHFLVCDDVFIITFSDLYDLFNLDELDISLMCYFAL
jgi:hypothetical protein